MTQITLSPPPAGASGSEQAVEFHLEAPGKQRVSLVGPFNGWDVEADPLVPSDAGWWAASVLLPPGRHPYQFEVDGVRVCDPRATEVVQLSEGVGESIAIATVGDEPYRWRHDDWQRPAFRDLLIYELHVADFSAAGTFEAVRRKLGYLKDLGINAIQLMPVSESALEEGWGYQPTHDFAVRSAYGSPEDLKRLIDQAHGHGIAVLLDLVLAHSAHRHPFNRLYPYEQSPWYGQGIGGTNAFGLPTFDHRKPATQRFARDLQRHWLEEFHVDGFRYDYAVNLGVEGENGLSRLAADAREVRPDVYLIAEHLPENPQILSAASLDACWHVRSSFALKTLALQEDHRGCSWRDFERTLRVLDPRSEGYAAATQMVNYIESHDEHRLVHDLRHSGARGDAARRRLALAATVLYTAPGIPMIYHGEEFGEFAFMGVNERNPLRWELLATAGGKALVEHHQQLAALRRARPALRADGFKIEAVHNDGKWACYQRWDRAGDIVVVAANFADEPRRADVLLPVDGAWHDVLSGHVLQRDAQLWRKVELGPSQAMVLVPGESDAS